ncbi:hypothetical protein QBC32DRAFT_369164 [Pseudoneurospora amorphoporcata]|uniref:Uncharacterized protein n=1 Tax=Pseudoneurospora amorphoporcata TaxID=241081 RepID=A0AAN6NZA9_9PEZI|nr:hypothetical protein QBC32DRAFT_369164 [Pseudoneurospora amorphoporcata]
MSVLKGQRSIQTVIFPLPPSLSPSYGNHTYRASTHHHFHLSVRHTHPVALIQLPPLRRLDHPQLLDMGGTFIPLCVADDNLRDVFLERVDRYITFPPTDQGFNDQTFVLGIVEVLRQERCLSEEEYEAWMEAVGGFRG